MTIAIIIILGLLYVYCEYRQQSAINQLKNTIEKHNDQEVLNYVKYVVEKLKNNEETLTFSEWNR